MIPSQCPECGERKLIEACEDYVVCPDCGKLKNDLPQFQMNKNDGDIVVAVIGIIAASIGLALLWLKFFG